MAPPPLLLAPDQTTRRDQIALISLLFLCAAIAFAGRGPVTHAMTLFDLGNRENPYFIPGYAFLLYVVTPVTSLALSVFLLAPGLVIAARFGSGNSIGTWLLKGFTISLVSIVGLTSVVQATTGMVLRGNAFFGLVLALLVFCALVSVLAGRGGRSGARSGNGRGGTLSGPDWHSGDLAFAGLASLSVLLVFSAKFYWENLSGDGGGTVQFTRLFINTLWPFWPEQAGTIAKAPSLTMVLFVLPASWFMRLLGESEFAVRVPYVLYTLMAYGVILDLIRVRRDDAGAAKASARVGFGVADHVLLIATLLLFTFCIVYSGGYNPYFGDSPMPAVREMLTMALFLGFILFFVRDEKLWMLITGLLCYLVLPTGGLWMLLWFGAVFLVWRPRPWPRLRRVFGIMVLCAVFGLVAPHVFAALSLPYGGEEFDAGAIVDRLRFVTVLDLRRLAFWAVPCGILPVVSLLYWRRQDNLSRALTVVSVTFFVFFYLQGYRVLLHHFIPCMLPPVIVFWRLGMLTTGPFRNGLRAAMAASLAVSVWLAWPKEVGLHRFDREIGQFMQASGPRFEGYDVRALDTAHILFGRLFPIGWDDSDARERFYGAPLVWYFYSLQPRTGDQVINYQLRPLETPPEGGRLFDSYDGYGLWIMDDALYEKQRTTVLPTDTGSPLFVVSRRDIFGRGVQNGPRYVIDLVQVARGALKAVGIHVPGKAADT